MAPHRRVLDKVLSVVGWTAMFGALGLAGMGGFEVATGRPLTQVLEGLWNGNTLGFLFLLCIAVGFTAFWARSFGRREE